MWRRLSSLGLGLVLALSLSPAKSHAQLGGMIKKAKDKAVPSAPAPVASTDQPARLPGPEITPAVVDHFLVGLKAEKAAKDRWAAGEGQRKEAEERRKKKEAEASMDPQTRHYMCVNDKMQADPRYPEFQKLGNDVQEAGKKGDNNTVLQLAAKMNDLQLAMQQRADSVCTAEKPKAGASPKAEQQAIAEAPAEPPEQAGAKAAGETPMDYAQIKELIYTYINYGKRAGLSEAEKKAVDAKIKELKDALKAIGMG